MSIQAIEFYSGIGGLHLALKRSRVAGKVVRAFDLDQTACRVYEENYGRDIVKRINISTLPAIYLSSLHATLWLMSPSCQPYTTGLNPSAKGAADPRAKSFLHIIEDVLPELVVQDRHPRYLFVENVAGFETSSTRQLLLATLKSLGYTTVELLLTPLQFGIPNSRLRYYLLARATPLAFAFSQDYEIGADRVWRHIPGQGSDWSDPRSTDDLVSSDPVVEIRRYLDGGTDGGEYHSYSVPDRVLQKYGKLFDIVLPSSRRSCCFIRGYTQLVERAGSILQTNEGLDTTSTFNDFLQAQEEGDANAVRILHPLGLRYFSPAELLRLFHFEIPSHRHWKGFEDGFLWPLDITTKSKYRLIGNSVNVEVVTKLLDFLFDGHQ